MRRLKSRSLHSLAILATHEISESRVIPNYTRNCTFGCGGNGGSKGKALYTLRQGKGSGRLEPARLETIGTLKRFELPFGRRPEVQTTHVSTSRQYQGYVYRERNLPIHSHTVLTACTRSAAKGGLLASSRRGDRLCRAVLYPRTTSQLD